MNRVLIALAVALCSGTGLAAADDACNAASSTSDVRFELALKDGRTTFQEGEIIPLVLTFSSAVKDRYWADDRTRDRNIRFMAEAYCVEPQAPDPLGGHLAAGVFFGGLSGFHNLDTPLVAEAELNEWRTLAPGHYRVYAIGYRVRGLRPNEDLPDGRPGVVLRSNTVGLDIQEPDPNWQREQISDAIRTLAGAPTPDLARHAARLLRFLNTQESTRKLAELWGPNLPPAVGFEMRLGLYGSPFRELAIRSMENEIAAPDHAITAEFLKTLVDLGAAGDPAKDTPSFDAAYQARASKLIQVETEKVAGALDGKAGHARAETLNGLLTAYAIEPALMEKIRPALIRAWPDLSEATADDLILNQWPLIRGPDMLPILRRIAAQPRRFDQPSQAQMRDAVLKRVMELDPEEGRALILRDALDPAAAPNLSVVKLLPAGDLATVVNAAVQRIGEHHARDVDYELLDLYADGGALSAAKAVVEGASYWECGSAHVIRYLLRTESAYAAGLIGAALSARKNTCYKGLLERLGDELPAVEDLAIRALDDPDPDVVENALVALRGWGTAGAEAAVWARLRRFHEEWEGREEQLRATPNIYSEGSRGVSLERSLVSTLAEGTGWICTPEKLALLADLATMKAEKQRIERWIEQWRGAITIGTNGFPEASPAFWVLQYGGLNEKQLAIKLAEFPSGTRIEWQFSAGETLAAQQAAFERMRAVAGKHGVTLEKLHQP